MCELSPVSFHEDTIFCIEHEGQPYTAMKPIVENMGLAWQSQAAKLTGNKDRWGITMIVIPSEGGEQETLCMPVRKLPAYLASINPKKVRAELRPKIELYQAESDDALWNYWMNGRADRQGVEGAITPDQQRTLQDIVDSKVLAIAGGSGPTRRVYYSRIWGNFNKHFRIAKYSQLPQSRLSEGIAYLVNMEIREPKELPQQQALQPSGDKYETFMLEVEETRKRIGDEISRLMDKGIELVDYRKFGPGCLSPYTYALADWLRDVLTRPSALVDGWRKADNALNYSPVGIFQKMEKDFEFMRGK